MTRIFTKKRFPLLEILGQVVIALSIASAAVYWFAPFGLDAAGAEHLLATVKGLSVGLLALFAFMNARRVDIFILALALGAATTGDIFISDAVGQMTSAVLAFGVGHVLYILLFLFNRTKGEALTVRRLRVASVVWAASGFGLFYQWRIISTMPVLMQSYALLALLMVTMALLSRYPLMFVGVGALLFFSSDIVLGLDLYSDLSPVWTNFIWPSYYLGQLLITLGVCLSSENAPRHSGTTWR